MWWIWRNRNLQRHGERILKPEELVAAAGEWQMQFDAANVKVKSCDTKRYGPGRVGEHIPVEPQVWKPLSLGCLKMNFDGATDVKNGVCGLGVVFRDHLGKLRGAMAVPQVGNISPRAVESLALLHGLRFALHVGFLSLEVEGNALTILNTLHDESGDLNSEGHILDEVKQLVLSFTSCSWHFVKCDCNMVAHRLAKESLCLSQPFLCLESGPSWLQ
ncbi:uncharacterized protein LOC112177827 [Rosa chinensis]|uniref:uncharacterized protein LOC112177827 n=1 Tax=Rosa chinensis TaxID=74649 RepID=UPI000D095E5A|nr:uncharacterized protein LOC112177827 [Rosa chinensis]